MKSRVASAIALWYSPEPDSRMRGEPLMADAPRQPSNQGQDPNYVRLEDLGGLIRGKRARDNLTLGQVSRLTGVSAATLSRWERVQARSTRLGDADPHKLAAVANWLGVRLDPAVVQIP